MPRDRELLIDAYELVYIDAFPNVDERESLPSIIECLTKKTSGWYGLNNYHVLVGVDSQNSPAAIAICDFLANAKVGVVEFLAVRKSFRRQGLGSQILSRASDLLLCDAKTSSNFRFLIAEITDPQTTKINRDIQPRDRAIFWQHMGFLKIDFPYIQPPLSEEKNPVRDLVLLAKPLGIESGTNISSLHLRKIISNYQKWAMGIEDVGTNPFFIEMSSWLCSHNNFSLVSLLPD